MKNKEGQNRSLNFKTPGLIPGMIAGLILGLLTQLHYLGFIAWELPYWRIIGGGLGGIMLGFLLTLSLGKGLSWLKILPREQPVRSPGWALLSDRIDRLAGLEFFGGKRIVMDSFGSMVVFTFLMKLFFRWIERTPQARFGIPVDHRITGRGIDLGPVSSLQRINPWIAGLYRPL